MNEHLPAVESAICDAADALLRMELTPEYEYRLRRDILGEPARSERLSNLKHRVLGGAMVAEVTAEQLWHGGWARFGTEDLTLRKKVPTTAFGVRRLVWLGLEAGDEPLARALDYLVDVFVGRRTPPEGGEVNERWPEVLRLRCASLIALIDPFAPCLDELLERWRFIAENTFRGGSYDYAACRELQAVLLNVRGSRLIPIPLQLLAQRPGFPGEALERTLLEYCWRIHLEGYPYWPEAKLDRLPACFRCGKTSRFMNTIESMVCFRGSAACLEPAIGWLAGGREGDGLWDYGPQAKDPGGYTRRLAAADWKKPESRKLDCTMEALAILKNYAEKNKSGLLSALAMNP